MDARTNVTNGANAARTPVGPARAAEVATAASTMARREAMVRDAFQRGGRALGQVASKETLENNTIQLPGAGANTLPKNAPGFFNLDERLAQLQARFPRFFAGADQFLKVGGVAAAFGSFGWSAWNLVSTWGKQSTASKALNSAATAANGAAAVEGVQFLRGAASASRLMGGFMGVAGTIYQGIQAFKEFNDPNKTAGQRGFATTAAVLSGIGTVACFIPGGQVVGFPLLLVGGILGMAGDWLGKMKWANEAFSWMGDKLAGAWHGLKSAGKAIADTGKKVVDGVKHAASGAWHALASFL